MGCPRLNLDRYRIYRVVGGQQSMGIMKKALVKHFEHQGCTGMVLFGLCFSMESSLLMMDDDGYTYTPSLFSPNDHIISDLLGWRMNINRIPRSMDEPVSGPSVSKSRTWHSILVGMSVGSE